MKSCIIYLIGIIAVVPVEADDKTEIEQTIRTVFTQSDARNWRAVESVFAPEVTLDYTSMLGGEPARLTPSQITDSWKSVLPGFESSDHQVSQFNIRADGEVAKATAQGNAVHHLSHPDGNTWTVDGQYIFELVKQDGPWKIRLMRFNLNKQSGNLKLPNIAQQRVKDSMLNTTQEVNIMPEKVSFASEGVVLKGNLYRPANFDENATYPAVVVAGTWTSVKEQMANRYAELLAQNGMIALSFDFRGYGESEGEPRNFENPEWKIQDIRNAVTYLSNLPETDNDEINGLGICAGAGYIAGAAVEDSRMTGISLVAPWLHNQALTHMIYGGEEGVAKLMQKSADAKKYYAETGTVKYVPAVSETDSEAAMYGPFDFYLNPERGAIPEWDGQFAVMAWEKWLGFDPIAFSPRVNTPTLIVHSNDAAIPDGANQFYARLSGKKDLIWTSGNQFDFYDNPSKVREAVMETIEWFGH